MKFLLIILSLSFSCYGMEITTEHDEQSEIETVIILTELRNKYSLAKWEVTDKVHIDHKSIPHSHPLLTLHTRHSKKGHEDLLLSTYLHEQIHWLLDEKPQNTAQAIEELKLVFTDVPVGFPIGASDEYSSYLHLLVCFMEIRAVEELLGTSSATNVLKFWQQDHYTWIYKNVEQHQDFLAAVVNKYDLFN